MAKQDRVCSWAFEMTLNAHSFPTYARMCTYDDMFTSEKVKVINYQRRNKIHTEVGNEIYERNSATRPSKETDFIA